MVIFVNSNLVTRTMSVQDRPEVDSICSNQKIMIFSLCIDQNLQFLWQNFYFGVLQEKKFYFHEKREFEYDSNHTEHRRGEPWFFLCDAQGLYFWGSILLSDNLSSDMRKLFLRKVHPSVVTVSSVRFKRIFQGRRTLRN